MLTAPFGLPAEEDEEEEEGEPSEPRPPPPKVPPASVYPRFQAWAPNFGPFLLLLYLGGAFKYGPLYPRWYILGI